MNWSFIKLFRGKQATNHRSRKSRPYRPTLEHLEAREVPAGITDMTDLAKQLVVAPNGPTHIYLNFDGYQDGDHTVAAYTGSVDDKPMELEDQINDILFRVSEMFSPFNVAVSRLDGFNNYDGGL